MIGLLGDFQVHLEVLLRLFCFLNLLLFGKDFITKHWLIDIPREASPRVFFLNLVNN